MGIHKVLDLKIAIIITGSDVNAKNEMLYQCLFIFKDRTPAAQGNALPMWDKYYFMLKYQTSPQLKIYKAHVIFTLLNILQFSKAFTAKNKGGYGTEHHLC